MVGKVSYPVALLLIAGIGTTFGATQIADLLTGKATGATPTLPADSKDAISAILCKIMGLLVGQTGKALATIAIIMLGIAAMLGKVTQHTALVVMVGIGVMFGATDIVGKLIPGANACAGGGLPTPTPCVASSP